MFWSIFLNSLALILGVLVTGTLLSFVLKGRTFFPDERVDDSSSNDQGA